MRKVLRLTVTPAIKWYTDIMPPGIRRRNGMTVISRVREGMNPEHPEYLNVQGEWQESPVGFGLREACRMFERFPKSVLPGGVTGGLPVGVYRDAQGGDCTNQGLTSRYSRAILIGPCIDQVFAPSNHDRGDYATPVLLFVDRVLFNSPAPYAVPLDALGGGHYMYGGNLITTSDSRFRWDCLKVHDRREDY